MCSEQSNLSSTCRECGYEPVVVAGAGGNAGFPADEELSKEVADVKRYDIRFHSVERKLDKMLKGTLGRWTRTSMLAWMKVAQRTVERAIEIEKPDILL